jgi:AcrR family transcriptional regulator
MSKNPKLDMRVKRSRKLLQDALLQLMKEKPFRDIQITEIADRAQVARPTFYLHYQSKQELLLSHVDDVFEEFYNEQLSKQTDPEQSCVMIFQYWERYAETLRMVIEANIDNEFRAHLRSYFVRGIPQFAPADFEADEQRMKFTIDFISGGAHSLLTQWVLRDMPYSAEQMGTLFYELSVGCVNALFNDKAK